MGNEILCSPPSSDGETDVWVKLLTLFQLPVHFVVTLHILRVARHEVFLHYSLYLIKTHDSPAPVDTPQLWHRSTKLMTCPEDFYGNSVTCVTDNNQD